MARTKRKQKSPVVAAASSSSSASDDVPVAALRKKLKGQQNVSKSKSVSESSHSSKGVESSKSTPEKKKTILKQGTDAKKKMGIAKLSGSVDKALLDCKFIKWENFNQVNFHFKELFEFQGWLGVCECANEYYPRLVQEFYRTLRTVDDEDRFEVILNTNTYSVSVELIATALKLPNDGNRISTHKDVARVAGFNLVEFENEVFPASTTKNEKSTSTKALQHIKIIHSMVNYVFCPKSGSYGYLSHLDMCIMWHIVSKVRLNLAYLIFKNMCKAYGIGKLPYAHLLTAVFKELEVNVSKESSRTDLMVLREIHSDTDGRKTRFEKGSSFTAKVDSGSGNEVLNEIQGLTAAVNDHFSSTTQSLDILRKFVDVVDYKVSHLLTQNEELKKLIMDLQQAKEIAAPTKVEVGTQVSADKGESNKVEESPADIACESGKLAEAELEPVVDAPDAQASDHDAPEIDPTADVPTALDDPKVVEAASELPKESEKVPESEPIEPAAPLVEPPPAPLVEPAAVPTQHQEPSLKDHQASAQTQLSAAAVPATKKGTKRYKSTVSNPYQTLAAALEPPSEDDEAEPNDQVADQPPPAPVIKLPRKKMVPTKSTRRSKRLK
ncbi:uncharacterized protein LOC131174694 [Hevea brasiliensis]|uniref:uncharacterized protein LOC131174694 n=1 Tax=Hevea brasiliensis TaxID=3981 RepID=UPI0025FDC2C7|nr:uncharacterized protein LOC131174694 [Hevea brasiliensis]